MVPLSRKTALLLHTSELTCQVIQTWPVSHTYSVLAQHTLCGHLSQTLTETWEGKRARQVKSHHCGHNVLMLMAWEAVNFPFPAVSASDSGPWNGAANILFITDIEQMALGRTEMDSPSIFHAFHYIDLLTRLLILKKARDIVCIWGCGWGMVGRLATTFFRTLGDFYLCQSVNFSGQSTFMRTQLLFFFFLFNLVGSVHCCYGHPVLLRTKVTQALYVTVKTSCQPPLGGNKHAN